MKNKLGMEPDVTDVFQFILDILNKEKTCSTSLKEIVDETGKTVGHVKSCLNFLKYKNHISIEVRRESRPNGLDITDPILISLI